MKCLYEKLLTDFEYTDERGSLFQLVHCGFSQINVLESKQGVVRGGHYHKISKEAFFIVSGSVQVTFRKQEEQQTRVFYKGDFFMVSPYTVHSMYFPENCIMVVMYDVPVEKEGSMKDIYPEEA